MTTEATKVQAIARIDPQALLTKAVEGNASIETLERLVALAKDVREVQAKEAFHTAMAEFQRRCPVIDKSSKANIYTARGSYTYSYAPLDKIMVAIRPLLAELGLSITWTSREEANRVVARCRVSHILGYSEDSGDVSMPIPDSSERGGGNPAQRSGSALTYAKRYSLLNVTGITPESDDDDAQSAHPQKKPTQPDIPPLPSVEMEPNLPGSVAPAVQKTLQTVDWWKEAYSATKDAEAYKRLEKLLEPEWHRYDPEEQVMLKMTRDKAKTRLGIK